MEKTTKPLTTIDPTNNPMDGGSNESRLSSLEASAVTMLVATLATGAFLILSHQMQWIDSTQAFQASFGVVGGAVVTMGVGIASKIKEDVPKKQDVPEKQAPWIVRAYQVLKCLHDA